MSLDAYKLVWLFPIAFILHDFEELLLFEPWLKKNAQAIKSRIKGRVPAFIERQFDAILGKSTLEFAFPICLNFLLACISAFLAAGFGSYSMFLIASSLFFLHGFMHVGQAMLLRRYVPALITSLLVAIPYGTFLFRSLIAAGTLAVPVLALYFLAAIVLAVPFILGIHLLGELVYKQVMKLFVG